MNEYDDDDRNFDDRPQRPRMSLQTYARQRVSFPAIILILFGSIGLILEIGSLITSFTNPTALADVFKDAIEKQPPGPDKDKWQKQFEESEDDLRMDSPVNRGSYILGTVLSVLMILGGVAMRSLGSYGLALTGAIAGLIPLGGCCCCSLPVGIWAIIVLSNADVKAAFSSRRATAPEEDY